MYMAICLDAEVTHAALITDILFFPVLRAGPSGRTNRENRARWQEEGSTRVAQRSPRVRIL